MTVKSLRDEDKLPIKQLIKAVNRSMDDVLRVVDALNLGRTEVRTDGVYRIFNNGDTVKVAEGVFKRRRAAAKRIKLF
ncbi:hypothetical protein [Pedobacter punctiformis]|uniref:DNA-binding protein n=1 Tax=Pedobacter punctiformis TaxID=3004097 RepID=A0ABT4L3P6_9SPHI|nr:hypothetical protein [Pedobacter sp. HCMS5-2]MCZ4242456.1 hypothetical protein [Pedobacter sp. HCMS5-2]